MSSPKTPLSGDDLHIIDALVKGHEDVILSTGLALFLFTGGVLSSVVSLRTLVFVVAAITIVISIFAITRHFILCRGRRQPRDAIWSAASSGTAVPDTSRLPAVYFTYILGSGGHTGELCELIKQSYRGGANLHRRYILTSGDTHSPNIVAMLETAIRDVQTEQRPTGTWDVLRVRRARRVHQPLWTTWLTSLLSAVSIVKALLQEPRDRPRGKHGGDFRYPHVIVTNGPGTGFVVCLVAHLLKMFFLVPRDRLKVVYVETWAHISTLSLTGKLFYYTDIADLFLVQHGQLAERTGKPCLQLFKPPIYAKGGGGARKGGPGGEGSDEKSRQRKQD